MYRDEEESLRNKIEYLEEENRRLLEDKNKVKTKKYGDAAAVFIVTFIVIFYIFMGGLTSQHYENSLPKDKYNSGLVELVSGIVWPVYWVVHLGQITIKKDK